MKTALTYRAAGVDVQAAAQLAQQIGRLAQRTPQAGVMPNRGEYAGLFRPPWQQFAAPLLAASCDGVGTKLLVAQAMQQYHHLGQDLVAMNVNDLLPCGAKPLFFLDYIACGSLQPAVLQVLVEDIVQACCQAGCALLGGETAEMPGIYAAEALDLAGFAVGMVDATHLPAAETVQVGDVVLGLPASGIHANGLSLARQALLERGGLQYSDTPAVLGGRSVGATLLTPTPIYVNAVLGLLQRLPVKVAAHVTGGGLAGRGSRLLQPGQRLQLQQAAFAVPPIFGLIASCGAVSDAEMAATFNLGLGYLAVVDSHLAQQQTAHWQALGFLQVGEVVAANAAAAAPLVDIV